MSRRGIVWPFVIILVIALATLLLLLPFLGKFFVALGGKTPKEICQSSVFANAALRLDRVQFSEDIHCKEELLTITTRDERKIKATLATAMTDCWQEFLEGKRQLFGDDGTYCHMCSHIEFKNKNQTITGFNDYLLSTRVPQKDTTYGIYLSAFLSSADVTQYVPANPAGQKGLGATTIDTSKAYAVMFLHAKGRDQAMLMLNSIATYAVATLLSPVGALILLAEGGVDFIAGLMPGSETAWLSLVELIEFNPDTLSKLGCQELVRESAQ